MNGPNRELAPGKKISRRQFLAAALVAAAGEALAACQPGKMPRVTEVVSATATEKAESTATPVPDQIATKKIEPTATSMPKREPTATPEPWLVEDDVVWLLRPEDILSGQAIRFAWERANPEGSSVEVWSHINDHIRIDRRSLEASLKVAQEPFFPETGRVSFQIWDYNLLKMSPKLDLPDDLSFLFAWGETEGEWWGVAGCVPEDKETNLALSSALAVFPQIIARGGLYSEKLLTEARHLAGKHLAFNTILAGKTDYESYKQIYSQLKEWHYFGKPDLVDEAVFSACRAVVGRENLQELPAVVWHQKTLPDDVIPRQI